MTLVSIAWPFIKYVPSRDSFDLDCFLASGYELSSRINKFPLLGTNDLPRVLELCEGKVNVDFLIGHGKSF